MDRRRNVFRYANLWAPPKIFHLTPYYVSATVRPTQPFRNPTLMPKAYYNEIDLYCAEWLYNLQKENLIAPGDIDTRPIQDVCPNDLKGYSQHHFFAGIGGWSYALRLADWPDDRPIWSGSCPCQPFSEAGPGSDVADERHLWPHFFWLIRQCAPSVVVGEQVASKAGRRWFSGVRADLEAMGFAVGASDLCAAGVAAPHVRQRIYWVADADGADQGARRQQSRGQFGQLPAHGANSQRLGLSESKQRDRRRTAWNGRGEFADAGPASAGMGVAAGESFRQRRQPWQQSEAVECDDGWRRIEPGAQPLAHGIPNRLDKISGYGNAIVPQVAQVFIQSVKDSIDNS